MAKPTAANAGKSNRVAELDKAMTEQERLDAMFKLTDAQWQEKQEEMSHAQRVQFQGGKPMKRANIPEGEPPHGYICYRCGKKGKFSQSSCQNHILILLRSLDPGLSNKRRCKLRQQESDQTHNWHPSINAQEDRSSRC
jgi:hypothetical protein